MKTINVGIIGLGTIGFGAFDILYENTSKINEKNNFNIKVHSVATKGVDEIKDKIPKEVKLLDNGAKIAEDKDIDIVVELMGGTTIAKDFVISAIKNKKHVVTANKAIISEFGKEIFKLAKENNVTISYGAAVGGVMPVIHTLKDYLLTNDIKEIKGILNGTCNFILTLMEQGLSYEESLKKAQEQGFAEADPTLDVNGADTAHKITILARLAFDMDITFNDIHFEGIQSLTNVDFDFAKQNGYKIKLLGIAKKLNGKYDINVRPFLISQGHLLAKVDNEYNAVFIEGNYSHPLLLVGKGAGRYPTATAVVNDIIEAAKKIMHETKEICPSLKIGKEKIAGPEEKETKGYLRILSVDKPGVLAAESKVFADNDINITEFFQKSKYKEKNYIPDIIIIDKTKISKIKSTIKQLNDLDCVEGKPFFLGIDE